MYDPLERFVQENRREFDQLEPSGRVLKNITRELVLNRDKGKRKRRVYKLGRWSVAAILLIAASLYLYQPNAPLPATTPLEGSASLSGELPNAFEKSGGKTLAAGPEEQAVFPQHETVVITNVRPQLTAEELKMTAIQRQLSQELSASSRILALIEVQKLPVLNPELIDLVVERVRKDVSSNVRLAAVEVILSRLEEPEMQIRLKEVFLDQDDPFVLAELIDAISIMEDKTSDAEIRHKLLALTENPQTMDLIKDKAYAALVRSY